MFSSFLGEHMRMRLLVMQAALLPWQAFNRLQLRRCVLSTCVLIRMMLFVWATKVGMDTLLVRRSQVPSQGTGAVNLRNADMAMY
jgi:hypothetical protein